MKSSYQRDPGLEVLLSGKRVAIVGPAPYLEGKGLGTTINNYDVVCRVNEVLPFGLEKDYGNRTDILFHCLNNQSIPILKSQLEQDLQVTKNIKVIVCPRHLQHASHPLLGFFRNPFCTVEKNFKKAVRFPIAFHHIGNSYYQHLEKDEIKGFANTGLLSMITLLNYDLKELFITGFSFYNSNDKLRYHSSLVKQYQTPERHHPVKNERPGHPQDFQIHYFKEILLEKFQDTIVIDSYIRDLFATNYGRVCSL